MLKMCFCFTGLCKALIAIFRFYGLNSPLACEQALGLGGGVWGR